MGRWGDGEAGGAEEDKGTRRKFYLPMGSLLPYREVLVRAPLYFSSSHAGTIPPSTQ